MAGENQKYKIGDPVAHRTLSFYAKPKPEADVFAEGLSQHIAEAVAEGLAKHGVEVARFKKKPAAAPPGPAVEKRAIWVVHGMGQQVPFETVDALAQGVLEALKAKPNGWKRIDPPSMVSTKFSDATDPTKTQIVQRIEIELQRPSTKQPGAVEHLELHLYEAYWAPLTEGVAKLSDVMSFLYDGALHGLLNCREAFRRAMFPKDTSPLKAHSAKEGKVTAGVWDFLIRKRTAAEIIVLLLMVGALAVINAVIVAASAAKLKFGVFSGWPVEYSWDQLTALATAVTAMALTFGAVLYLAVMSEPAKAKVFSKGAICILGWITLVVTAGSILVAGVLMGLIFWSHGFALWFRNGMHYRATQFVSTIAMVMAAVLCLFASLRGAFKKSQGKRHRIDTFPRVLFFAGCALHASLLILLLLIHFFPSIDPWFVGRANRYVLGFFGSGFWVWPSLLYVSKQIGNIIVEYAGDVAIYVTPNKLDRFNDARQKIKQLALDSLMPLYSARGATVAEPLYSQIAIVGHSLGSVIAYDTLNKLLMLDDLLDPVKPPIGVAHRTRILETFGSPLDKTAFFFSYQGTENFNIREQLAACVQPLIQDYAKYRKFPWVNVYSWNDIISGNLKFYDVVPPGSAVPPATYPVDNVVDPDAIVPLIAHVEYWTHTILWKILVDHIT